MIPFIPGSANTILLFSYWWLDPCNLVTDTPLLWFNAGTLSIEIIDRIPNKI